VHYIKSAEKNQIFHICSQCLLRDASHSCRRLMCALSSLTRYRVSLTDDKLSTTVYKFITIIVIQNEMSHFQFPFHNNYTPFVLSAGLWHLVDASVSEGNNAPIFFPSTIKSSPARNSTALASTRQIAPCPLCTLLDSTFIDYECCLQHTFQFITHQSSYQ